MEKLEQAFPEFPELLQKYSAMVLRVAFANVKNMQDAQDIAQDVFLSVLTKQPQFESEEHEKAWLIRVTINRCRNHAKSFWNKRTEGLSEDLSYMPKEETGVLEEVLKLPKNYRNAIHLYYYEGYSINEIADLLHKKPATVGTWLARGRTALKSALKGGFDDEA
ncbi:RNA polymerase sigma factor [Anaeromassilibacillus senegalensis]|uniref:RNA polymerase sigma factor n=1 Tax=Anaeromassilibacillus senegalensis TaxID=1673717 RepID=UPI00093AE0A2|nr:sigma-70 family RNA polymerase sigma factor [Anaeromassilibacillus senegalensis]